MKNKIKLRTVEDYTRYFDRGQYLKWESDDNGAWVVEQVELVYPNRMVTHVFAAHDPIWVEVNQFVYNVDKSENYTGFLQVIDRKEAFIECL